MSYPLHFNALSLKRKKLRNSKALLRLERVSKSIDGNTILRDINLEIGEGEFLSILGASGSGKSSLLYIMALLDRPTSGEVFFEEDRINFDEELSPIRNSKIGFVFQFHYLLPELTAVENVIVPMLKAGITKEKSLKRAGELLKKLGLEGKEDRKPYQLSGGEQQRVAIARAIANEPKVLFADEPTGNLDSKNSETVMDIFLKLNSEGNTIVMVTHEEELAEFGTRVLTMSDGRILEERAIEKG